MGWKFFGHPEALSVVSNRIYFGTMSHAVLVVGAEHSGRRTLAMDVARALNCIATENKPGERPSEPCGECSQCVRISKGTHADIRTYSLETLKEILPRAKGTAIRRQIPIEAIQMLRRETYLKPFEGRTRVFIIDGAELMSPSAANALLKTLEEPPPQVTIVLVASSTDALLSTIVSRCMIVSLRASPVSLIKKGLVEMHGADYETAERFAQLSRGRPGWAVVALDDPSLTEKNVQSAMRAYEMAVGDTESRFRTAAEIASQWHRSPTDVRDELDCWVWWWRDLAMIKAGQKGAIMNATAGEDLERLAATVTMEQVTAAINALLKTKNGIEANVGARLSVELLALSLPQLSAV